MFRIKQMLRHLLPIFVLPLFLSVNETLRQVMINTAGMNVSAAYAVFSRMTAGLKSTPYVLAMIGLGIAAVLAEAGNLKKAKIVHVVTFIVCCCILAINLFLLIAVPENLTMAMTSSPEVTALTAGWMRSFAVTVLAIGAAGGLIAQMAKGYSMILTLCMGIVLQIAALVLCFLSTIGVAGLEGPAQIMGLSVGIEFASSCVLPFVLIPLATYYKSCSVSGR